jgi:hypothetical protein
MIKTPTNQRGITERPLLIIPGIQAHGQQEHHRVRHKPTTRFIHFAYIVPQLAPEL